MTYRARCEGRRRRRVGGRRWLYAEVAQAFEPGPLGWSITITEAGVALDVVLPPGTRVEVSFDSGRTLSYPPVPLMTTSGPYECGVDLTFTPDGERWLVEAIEASAREWVLRWKLLELLRARANEARCETLGPH